MKKVDLSKNAFDLNHFPAEWGMLLFPISMSRIVNAQSAEACIEHLRWFSKNKISSPTVGVNIIYGDSLYLNYFVATNDPSKAYEKNLSYLQEIENHKFGMLKMIKKLSTTEFQIPEAFQFSAWHQALLSVKSFSSRFKKLKKIYNVDSVFQKYLQADAYDIGKDCDEAQINFFLEEHLLVYLMCRDNVLFHNDHVEDRQKWVIWCYPGKPPRALIYLHQLNPFKLAPTANKFEQMQYDLTKKKLYDAKVLDLQYYDHF